MSTQHNLHIFEKNIFFPQPKKYMMKINSLKYF